MMENTSVKFMINMNDGEYKFKIHDQYEVCSLTLHKIVIGVYLENMNYRQNNCLLTWNKVLLISPR